MVTIPILIVGTLTTSILIIEYMVWHGGSMAKDSGCRMESPRIDPQLKTWSEL